MVDTCDSSSKFMTKFVNLICGIIAYCYVSSKNRKKVCKIPEFVGLPSFEIDHDKLCKGLFSFTKKKAVTIDDQTYTKNCHQIKSTKNLIVYAT